MFFFKKHKKIFKHTLAIFVILVFFVAAGTALVYVSKATTEAIALEKKEDEDRGYAVSRYGKIEVYEFTHKGRHYILAKKKTEDGLILLKDKPAETENPPE